MGSRDDHGQPIAGGNDQKCRRRVGSRSTGIQEQSCYILPLLYTAVHQGNGICLFRSMAGVYKPYVLRLHM